MRRSRRLRERNAQAAAAEEPNAQIDLSEMFDEEERIESTESFSRGKGKSAATPPRKPSRRAKRDVIGERIWKAIKVTPVAIMA